MSGRTPEQIRASIETNRVELGAAVQRLRGDIAVVTDWRRQLERHRAPALLTAAVAGFVIGGGIAAIGGLFRRGR